MWPYCKLYVHNANRYQCTSKNDRIKSGQVLSQVLRRPGAKPVWHLIARCRLCVGSTPTSASAKNKSQCNPGC